MPGPDFQPDPVRLRGKPSHFISGAIRDSGLVSEGDRGVVLISGGADSVALLLGLDEVLGPENLVALHVNYGLRPTADRDQGLVRGLCERQGIELIVLRAGEPAGNLQAWARSIRLEEAERIRRERGLDWIAVGHNRSDQAETFLYRLASSPGARSLLAMPPRSGNVIRPLLSLDRGLIRRMLGNVAPYAEDPTNQDPAFARNRIRMDVLPGLQGVNQAAELNIVRTREELAEDEDALATLAEAAAGEQDGLSEGLPGRLVAARHPALGRRMIRQMAESALRRPVAVTIELTSEAVRLALDPEGGRLDLGGGDYLLMEAGSIRAISGGGDGAGDLPEPVTIDLDGGSATFGGWEVDSSVTADFVISRAPGHEWKACLDRDRLIEWLLATSPGVDDLLLNLRPWRPGDRIEPLGMEGSRSLQDVFTDAQVPASRRRSWPVLVIGETPIWVPGLVRSRHLLIEKDSREKLRLEVRPPFVR